MYVTEKMYACFMNGDIVVADTKSNPCLVIKEWPCKDIRSKLCLHVFSIQKNHNVKLSLGKLLQFAATCIYSAI